MDKKQPESTDQRVTVIMKGDLYRKFKVVAAQNGHTFTEVINDCVQKYTSSENESSSAPSNPSPR